MRRKLVLTPDLVSRVERKIPQDHLPPDPDRAPMTDADYAEAVTTIITINLTAATLCGAAV